MRKLFLFFLIIIPFFSSLCAQTLKEYPALYASDPRFKILLHYDPHVEEAHVQFAKQSIDFFRKLSVGDGFLMDVTTSLDNYPLEKLKEYSILVSLNAQPKGEVQRKTFQRYMQEGGGWMGFHASAYNDKHTKWSWFNEFLGCGVFYCNNWPPQPVLLEVNLCEHDVTRCLPKEWVAPASEWYMWNPSPRENADVDILLSISPKNMPLGIKDIIRWGDIPVVWTNRNFRMIYLNTGHGDEAFIDATQNLLFVNAFRWLVQKNLGE